MRWQDINNDPRVIKGVLAVAGAALLVVVVALLRLSAEGRPGPPPRPSPGEVLASVHEVYGYVRARDFVMQDASVFGAARPVMRYKLTVVVDGIKAGDTTVELVVSEWGDAPASEKYTVGRKVAVEGRFSSDGHTFTPASQGAVTLCGGPQYCP